MSNTLVNDGLLSVQTDTGHVALRQMIRDESWDLWILSMELMNKQDKAAELCHMLHTGSSSVAALLEAEDRQTRKEAYLNEGQSPSTPWLEMLNVFTQTVYFASRSLI